MAVDLTTGSYDEAGIFSKYSDISKPVVKSTIEENLCSLKNFNILKILKEGSSSKSIVVEGRFIGDERPAIIVVEKMPFDTRDLSHLFSPDSRLELKFRNNIYANYHVYLKNGLNGIGVQVIHPAREEDFAKYIDVPVVMVTETMELYEAVLSPHFKSISLQQSHDSTSLPDSETIYRDINESASFVLVKENVEKCSCSSVHFRAKAVLLQKEMLSLRDLTASNVPLLIELKKKCLEELSTKYKVPSSKIEGYVSYPPVRFPFHVLFETVEKDCAIAAEKAHHLDTIISNLQLIPDYYKRVTLTYSLPESDILLKKMLEYKKDAPSN